MAAVKMETFEPHVIFINPRIDLKYVHTQITSSPDQCQGWLQQHGLLACSRLCDCGNSCTLVTRHDSKDDKTWKCNRKSCRKRYGLREGSFFENSELPLRTLVELLYWWSIDTRSSIIRHEFGAYSHDEVVDWLSRLREFCADLIRENSKPIGGVDVAVEVNVIRNLYRHETHLEVVYMLGLVERDNPSNSLLLPCPENKTDPASLLPLIQLYVLPGTTVLTDEWTSFNDLQDVVTDKAESVNGGHSQLASNGAGDVKRKAVGSSQLTNGKGNRKEANGTYLSDSCLYEFVWRRKHKARTFEHLISDICNYYVS